MYLSIHVRRHVVIGRRSASCGAAAIKIFSLSCGCAGAQTVTVPLAFTAVQQALAAIHFESKLSEKPAATLSDPGRCLPSAITGQTVMANFVRHLKYACFTYNRSCIGSQLPCKQTATVCVAVSCCFCLCLLGTKWSLFSIMFLCTQNRGSMRALLGTCTVPCRFLANSLDAMVIKYAATNNLPQDTAIITGIADDSVFNTADPTWLQPTTYQNKCYVGARHASMLSIYVLACCKTPDGPNLIL